MALSSEAQALFDHARNSLPRWLTGGPSAALEWLYSFTEIFDEVRALGQGWLDIATLDAATGAELDQHALDRGTTRRSGESDASLRERIRQITDTVTEPALILGVNRILDAQGLRPLLRTKHVVSGWDLVLEAKSALTDLTLEHTLTFSATGVLTIAESLNSDGSTHTLITYESGITMHEDIENIITLSSSIYRVKTASPTPASPTISDITNAKMKLCGLVSLRRDRGHYHAPTFSSSFLGRGYRMTRQGRPMAYTVILPYGTTAATANAVSEYLRQNGPAGFLYYVERRINP